MNRKKLVYLALSAVVQLIMFKSVLADGFIIVAPPIVSQNPRTMIMSQREALPVKYHRVNVKIENGVATTSIDQVFKNPYDADLEGTYLFPIPENAAIKNFSLYMDGQKVEAKLLDRNVARGIYESIVRQMRDPGLLEYAGRNLFQARIYPIPKHGERRIEISYQNTLEYDSGVYKYVYPLNTEKFSPIPLEEVAISVNIASKTAIKNVYCPSHDVDTHVKQYEASAGYEEKNVKPEKDFILYYTVSEKDMGLNLLTHKKVDEDGYFILMLAPGEMDVKVVPKDIIFVLDTSGSMLGNKIQQARDALKFCINNLGKDDNFNVISFATGIEILNNSMFSATTENTNKALNFIDSFQARGGTNIDEALKSGLNMFKDNSRPCMIVFLTDGEPTVGVTDLNEIIKNISQANKIKARLFVFGVGNDVNTHFLDTISENNKGVSDYVVNNENIETKVSSFYQKIKDPVLSNISLNFTRITANEIYPLSLPDIFRGTQLIVTGRYHGDGPSAITLKGTVNGVEKTIVFEDRFAAQETNNDFIPRIWAMRKIGYLMNEIRLKGTNRELVDEIVRLSKEFGIMTPYTSFLVLENEQQYERFGISRVKYQNIKKSGVEFEKNMNMSGGAESISIAKDVMELKTKQREDKVSLENVKHAGDKTFYLKGNVWIDAKYEEKMTKRNVKYLSDEYFELLNKNPNLGKYFAVGTNLILVVNNECIQINE